MRLPILLAALGLMAGLPLAAQDNYEIQVYAAETMAPGRTMVELHSNYTYSGPRDAEAGVRPDARSFHETIEITQGITPWFEAGASAGTARSPRGRPARADFSRQEENHGRSVQAARP